MMQASLGPRGVSSLFPHSTGSHASHARPSALRSPCDAQPPPAPPPTLPSGVFLACLTRGPRPTTSVAFYSTASRVLHVGAFPDASVVAHLKHRVQPTLILTAAQPDSDAFHALAHNDLDPAAPFAVRSLKAAAWTAEAGLQRLRLLRLSSSPDVQQRAHPFRHLMHVRALVDTADPLITSVLGALLTHLGGEGGGGDCLTVDDIRAVSGDWVRVDRWTVRGLGVFREDGHPGAGGRGKEGPERVRGVRPHGERGGEEGAASVAAVAHARPRSAGAALGCGGVVHAARERRRHRRTLRLARPGQGRGQCFRRRSAPRSPLSRNSR